MSDAQRKLRQEEDDALWNEALEKAVKEMAAIFGDRFTQTDKRRVLALKRGGK